MTTETYPNHNDNSRVITCMDCAQDFPFSTSEAAFYAERGFTPPKRCRECRARRKRERDDDRASY